MSCEGEKERRDYDHHQHGTASAKRGYLEHYRVELCSVLRRYPAENSIIKRLRLSRHHLLGEFSKGPYRNRRYCNADNEKCAKTAENCAGSLDGLPESGQNPVRVNAKTRLVVLVLRH